MSVSNKDRASFDRKIARAIDLVKSEKSYMEAARIVGLNKNTVTKYCEMKGVASPRAAKLESRAREKFPKMPAVVGGNGRISIGEPTAAQRDDQTTTTSSATIDLEKKPSLWERIKRFLRWC